MRNAIHNPFHSQIPRAESLEYRKTADCHGPQNARCATKRQASCTTTSRSSNEN